MNGFLQLVNMTLGASAVIGIVLVLRLLLRRAPKKLIHLLWGVVLLRLLCPWTLELPRTPMPARQIVAESSLIERREEISLRSSADAALRAVGDTLNGGIDPVYVALDRPELHPEGTAEADPAPAVSARHGQVWLLLLGKVYPIGLGFMLAYTLWSLLRLRRQTAAAIGEGEGIWLADHIQSPFVWGLWRPRIYLPSDLEGEEREYIILHERTHIARLDHLTRPLAWLALCIHWFNPLVWLAFYLSGHDMEMACDEAVLDRLGSEIRKDYCTSLVRFAEGPRLPGVTFSEGNVEGRVRNLLQYKKPALWLMALVVVLILLLGLFMLTSGKNAVQDAEDFRIGFTDNGDLKMVEAGHWDVFGEKVGEEVSSAYLIDRLEDAVIRSMEEPLNWEEIEYKIRMTWDDRICMFGYSPNTPEITYGQWIAGSAYTQPVQIESEDIAYNIIESVEHWHNNRGVKLHFEHYVYEKQYASYSFEDVLACRVFTQLLPFCTKTDQIPRYKEGFPTDQTRCYVVSGERNKPDGMTDLFVYYFYPDEKDDQNWFVEIPGETVYTVNENIVHSLERAMERHYAVLHAPAIVVRSGENQTEVFPRDISGLLGDFYWGTSLKTIADEHGMPFTLYDEKGTPIDESRVVITISEPMGGKLEITDVLDRRKGSIGHLYPALKVGAEYAVDLRLDLGNLDGYGDSEYAEYGFNIIPQ